MTKIFSSETFKIWKDRALIFENLIVLEEPDYFRNIDTLAIANMPPLPPLSSDLTDSRKSSKKFYMGIDKKHKRKLN